ncbi:uncharacterized protein LOC133869258 [Alnus glutinosa]|uniref:uncharacterized protein LOC133869258 n=1 Tax=Alnus glutinosa TaxID=3517 RepID=UPI002D789362|nr:uncharacterized protein LOC133869258 [Alnus glutinosa]
MEEDDINTPGSGRQEANVDLPCSSSHSSTVPSLEFQVAGDTSTTLNTGTSHGESVQIDISEPCPIECRPLLYAAIKGDWPAAKAFLENYPHHVRTPITEGQATAFHIAAAAQHTTFITQMLKLIVSTPKVLESETTYGFTALHSAAQSGNVRIAEQLVKMNRGLLSIPDRNEDTPLIVAAYLGHKNMVSYLFTQTRLEHLTNAKRIELLEFTIDNDMFDVALEILNKDQNIATAGTELWFESLKKLARKPFAIGSESQLSFWKSLLKYSC